MHGSMNMYKSACTLLTYHNVKIKYQLVFAGGFFRCYCINNKQNVSIGCGIKGIKHRFQMQFTILTWYCVKMRTIFKRITETKLFFSISFRAAAPSGMLFKLSWWSQNYDTELWLQWKRDIQHSNVANKIYLPNETVYISKHINTSSKCGIPAAFLMNSRDSGRSTIIFIMILKNMKRWITDYQDMANSNGMGKNIKICSCITVVSHYILILTLS